MSSMRAEATFDISPSPSQVFAYLLIPRNLVTANREGPVVERSEGPTSTGSWYVLAFDQLHVRAAPRMRSLSTLILVSRFAHRNELTVDLINQAKNVLVEKIPLARELEPVADARTVLAALGESRADADLGTPRPGGPTYITGLRRPRGPGYIPGH